jgi:hypothetical protein
MSETDVVGPEGVEPGPARASSAMSDEQLIAMLVDRARGEGLRFTGEGGLLQQLTKRVLDRLWEARSPTTAAMRSTRPVLVENSCEVGDAAGGWLAFERDVCSVMVVDM